MPRGRVRTPAMLAAQIVQMAACAIVVSYAAAHAGFIPTHSSARVGHVDDRQEDTLPGGLGRPRTAIIALAPTRVFLFLARMGSQNRNEDAASGGRNR
jgi:hypothetical protein